MHRLVASVHALLRSETDLTLDRNEVRLAVLQVADHIGEVLSASELSFLAEALPLELTLLLLRRRDAGQPAPKAHLEDALVHAICRVLSERVASGAIQMKLRHDVPRLLRSGRSAAHLARARVTAASMSRPMLSAV